MTSLIVNSEAKGIQKLKQTQARALAGVSSYVSRSNSGTSSSPMG